MTSKGPRRAQMRRLVERYDGDALWTLITAAGAAPGVRHRWATLGHLLAGALRAEQRGRRPVRSGDLQRLLDACVADEPRLIHLEDFLPKDPREEVLIRVDDVVLRLFPGSVERPVADVRRALLVAEAIDGALTARLGFGVRDLLTATLAFIDRAIAVMASAWPTGELAGDGPVVLSAGELEAAAVLGDATMLAALGLSPQQERALGWATGAVADVPYVPDHPQSPFGRYLRVARHGPEAPASWMPLSHIPEILGYAVVELAQQAATVPEVRRAFDQAAAAATRRALWFFSSTVLGPPDLASGPAIAPSNYVQWVAMLGPGRAVLVQLASELNARGLSFREMPAALQVARDAQAAPGQPLRVPMPGGVVTLAPNVEVVPLLVVASAGHIAVPQRPGLPAMSLDDLQWAASSATADSDLFLFCRDLARPDRPNFFAWETINVWEWWRSNGKTLFAGGQQPTLIMIAPHAGDAEWDRRRGLAPLERGLATLALPGLADVDAVDHDRAGPPEVYQWVNPETLTPGPDRTAWVEPGRHRRGDLLGWTVYLSDVPVAIVVAHPGWPQAYHELLHDLAGAFAFGFRQIDYLWRSVHSGQPVDGYVIDLTSTNRDGAPGMQVTTVETALAPNGHIVRATIEVCPDIVAAEADSNIATVRTAMASAVQAIVTAAALRAVAADEIAAAWTAAPPTLAVRVLRTPTVRNDLSAPIRREPALIAEVDRIVAEAVRDTGVQPGTYTGDTAKALDRDVLAPAALRVLTDRLQAFAMDNVVLAGMREIERVVADRDRQVRDLEQSARLLHLDWDPIRRYADLERDHLVLRRCAEVVVESALRTQPDGDRPVDRVAWAETAAAADAYLSATMRSEHVHHQVRPTALKISHSYEIEVSHDPDPEPAAASAGAGRVYDLDMDALRRARSTLQLGDPAEDDAAVPESDETSPAPTLDPQDSPAPVLTPELDAALHQEFGASGSDLLTTLFALAHWPLTDNDDDVIAAPVEAVVEHVLDYTILGDDADGRTRVEHAVTLLTSTSQGLVTADWKPWHVRSRRRRLLIQPLPMLSDGRLVVAPHFCLGAMTAYQSHLSQGQLPWTQPAPDEPSLPAVVTAALEAVRHGRNTALEGMVAEELRHQGWLVIDNIKKTDPQRLNAPTLSGQIDVVTGKPGQRTVWLLEVKDPADTYVVSEIRRHLDTFFVDRGSKLSYATRLRCKVEDLAPHIDAVAAALGLPPHAEGYELAAAFITRTPVPAAFVSGPFPFASLPELFTLLAPIEPRAALSWPGDAVTEGCQPGTGLAV